MPRSNGAFHCPDAPGSFRIARVMPLPSSLSAEFSAVLHAAPMRMALLLAASAWTAAACHIAARHAAQAKPMLGGTPKLSTLALCAAGVIVWAGNAIEQPMLSANVAALSIAFMTGWEIGGVLERIVQKRR